MHSILRQPKANFAIAKFGFNRGGSKNMDGFRFFFTFVQTGYRYYLLNLDTPKTNAMCTFSEKATQSLQAARMLVKEHYYPSTVNRSYFACMHYFMYALFERLKLDKTQFYHEMRRGHCGTHSWITRRIGQEIARASQRDYHWFRQHIASFKRLRIKCDYTDETITAQDGNEAIGLAMALMNLVGKYVR